MNLLIAVPVYRIACKVQIDKGRSWSVIDELVLWAITRQSKTIAALADESRLPRQVIVASIARLMRFRLVEVRPIDGGAAFRASEFGFSQVASGRPLPYFPKRQARRVGFVIERVTGDFFPRVDRLMSGYKLDREKGVDIRRLVVEDGGPSISHEENLSRLADIVARRLDEEIASIDGRTATLREDEFMVIRVSDGVMRGLPETAGAALREAVERAAALPPASGDMPLTYMGPRDEHDYEPIARDCEFSSEDLIIGGSQQRECLLRFLESAQQRVIIHSTFLDAARFAELLDPIRAACRRGVTFDLLWGAEAGDDSNNRNSKAAVEISRMIRQDRELNGRVMMHMQTTGSHAKVMLLDTKEGWIGAVGSCNWLSSPFRAVELSVVLRNNMVVADLATALQRMVGRRGLANNIATEMALTSRDLRREGSEGGPASLSVVVGEGHDRLIRTASGSSKNRFFVGSNRLGSTARPGAIMPGEVAARREGVAATVLYSEPSGPLKRRHARALAAEAAANGVRLIRTRKIPLHGKIVAWDDDDVIVTSLNWASASSDPSFPWADIGVRIHLEGLAAKTLKLLEEIFVELRDDDEETERAAG